MNDVPLVDVLTNEQTIVEIMQRVPLLVEELIDVADEKAEIDFGEDVDLLVGARMVHFLLE